MSYSQRILVDIECLLDTRIGLVKHLAPEALTKLPYQVYAKRFTDTWARIIGVEDWKEKWMGRDINALMCSRPTMFFYSFREHLEMLLLEIQMHSPLERPQVTINMAPYVLTPEEQNIFKEVFSQQFDMVRIELINEPLANLTPERLKIAFDGWYLYNWYEWIELNCGKFGETRMPAFTIMRPALLSPDVTEEGFETLGKATANPFTAARQYFCELVALDTVDVAVFSLDLRHWNEVCQVTTG